MDMVGGFFPTPLKKIGVRHPIYGKKEHVPNYQPVSLWYLFFSDFPLGQVRPADLFM